MNSAPLAGYAAPLARVLIALIFILGGIGKVADPAGNLGYMAAYGVPGQLLYVAALVEVLGGALILVGYQTRLAALALAGFTALAALIFHSKLSDPNQMIHFLKNLSIVGGLLVVYVNGAGSYALDRRATV